MWCLCTSLCFIALLLSKGITVCSEQLWESMGFTCVLAMSLCILSAACVHPWCDFLPQTILNSGLLWPSAIKLLAKQGQRIQTNTGHTANKNCQACIAGVTSLDWVIEVGEWVGVDPSVPGSKHQNCLVGALFTLSSATTPILSSLLQHSFLPSFTFPFLPLGFST